MSKAADFAKKHWLFPLICLIFVLVLVFSSQFCLKINVSGDFDDATVREALMRCGIRPGADLSKVDLPSLQNSLANELGAAYVSVRRSGSVLFVSAAAQKQILPPIELDSKRNIVASRSGVVTNVLCEQGTALVRVGDRVQKGDVLIEGKRVFSDGTSEDVYALGAVTLSVESRGFAPFDGTTTLTVQTGRQFCSTGVVLFGKEYAPSCPFEQYTLQTTVTKLFPLNVEIRTNVFCETEQKRVPATLEQCFEQLSSLALNAALANCDFTVIDSEINTQKDGVAATVFGEVIVR